VLQNFTELLTCYKSTPFAEGSGYDDNQFFDGEDPMQSVFSFNLALSLVLSQTSSLACKKVCYVLSD